MKKKGFSLIEILVVLMLISIVYSVYFYSQQKTNPTLEYTLLDMKHYMNIQSKKYETPLKAIYSNDEKKVFITDHQYNLLETIAIDLFVTQYILKENEELEVADYKPVQIGDWYTTPSFIMTQYTKNIFSNIVLLQNSKWIYFNSHFGNPYEIFDTQQELIDFAKKKEFIPAYAGDIE